MTLIQAIVNVALAVAIILTNSSIKHLCKAQEARRKEWEKAQEARKKEWEKERCGVANDSYFMTREKNGTIEIHAGDDGRIRLYSKGQVKVFLTLILDLCEENW